jgi:ribosomal protein S18 acetylase RimI-like enzyme
MILVRKAGPDDMAGVVQLYVRCRADAAWLPPQARKRGDLLGESEGEMSLIACDEHGALLGFVSALKSEAFIHHLYVDQSARGRGVGSTLLDALRDHISLPWQLKCLVANEEAQAFYRRLGWKAVGAGQAADGAYLLLQLQN